MPTTDFKGQTCGIYPRVSSQKQAHKGKSSLPDQEATCRDYAADMEMIVDEACVKPEAYTSTVMKRPELNQLLAQMKARHVSNLIIDRVDRMTRGGMLVAATFLQQFTRAGITLHVVSMGNDTNIEDDEGDENDALVVRDDKGVKDFLDAAYNAQQDNKKRTRIVKRAKRSRARGGTYLRGKWAPYGFRYVACAWDAEENITDKRMVPDERLFADLGFPTMFAPTPYAARRRMLQLYGDGMSYGKIANLLNSEGVPTSSQLHHSANATPTWVHRTVNYLVTDKLNEGILTNFRQKYKVMDPDDEHEEEWVRVVPIPFEQQIIVTPPDGSPAPLADADLLARIAHHRAMNRRITPNRVSSYIGKALLAGGLANCALCGGGVGFRSSKRRQKVYLYYTCSRHSETPTACPGWSLQVSALDPDAWRAAMAAMGALGENDDGVLSENENSYLNELAKRQATLGATSLPSDELAGLCASRDAFQQQLETLASEVGKAQSQTARDALQRQMDRLGPEIDKANRRIASYQRQAALVAERRQLLSDYVVQWRRYSEFVLGLDPSHPQDIPTIAELLRTMGAQFLISKDERGQPEILVELTITRATAKPWVPPEMLETNLDIHPDHKIDFGVGTPQFPAQERDTEGERPSFPAIGSSLKRSSPPPSGNRVGRRSRQRPA